MVGVGLFYPKVHWAYQTASKSLLRTPQSILLSKYTIYIMFITLDCLPPAQISVKFQIHKEHFQKKKKHNFFPPVIFGTED